MNGIPEPKVRPIILAVDDERKDLELVERELRKRYEAAYHVACGGSVGAELERLQRLKAFGQDVAVVLAGRRIAGLRKPRMSGVDFLARVRGFFALTKRTLLLDPMDMDTRSLLPRAMALVEDDVGTSPACSSVTSVERREPLTGRAGAPDRAQFRVKEDTVRWAGWIVRRVLCQSWDV
jgi:hypothetical protein